MKRSFPGRLIHWLETRAWSPGQLLALFAATVILRNLLEGLQQGDIFHWTAFVYHFPVAYVFPSLALVAALHYLAGRYRVSSLAKLMVFAWTLTLLPPVIDAIIGRSGSGIGYFPLERSNLVYFLVNFFNPTVELSGTTAGIRIEAAIGCLLAGFFVAIVTERRSQKLFRGALTTVLFAPVFLCFFTWPYLVHALLSRSFPWLASTQTFYQWRVVTHQSFVGAVHLGVFLMDLIPVTALLIWFLRKVDSGLRESLSSLFRRLPLVSLPALAGTAAAAVTAIGLPFAPADILALCGGFLAAVSFGAAFSGLPEGEDSRLRSGLFIYSALVALAVGWHSLVLVLLGLALSAMRMPRMLRRGLVSAMMFLLASSPVLVSLGDWASRWPLLVAFIVAGALPAAGRKRPHGRSAPARHLLMVPVVILALIWSGSWKEPRLADLEDRAAQLTRSWRIGSALAVSRRIPAAGGHYRMLAQTAQTLGNAGLAGWAFETGLHYGDSSMANLKVGLNLALQQEDWTSLDRLVPLFVSRSGAGSADVSTVMYQVALRRSVAMRDQESLDRIFETTGPSADAYMAYADILADGGDETQARRFLLAACSQPDATPATWASLLVRLGDDQALLDSVAEEAERAFPGSTDIMLARVLARSDSPPVGEEALQSELELLRSALEIEPFSARAHRVAASWFAAIGELDSALSHASIAIALEPYPDMELLELACSTELLLEEWSLLLQTSRYAADLNPGLPRFRVYSSRALTGLGRADEASRELELMIRDSFGGEEPVFPDRLMDSLCVYLSDSLL